MEVSDTVSDVSLSPAGGTVIFSFLSWPFDSSHRLCPSAVAQFANVFMINGPYPLERINSYITYKDCVFLFN